MKYLVNSESNNNIKIVVIISKEQLIMLVNESIRILIRTASHSPLWLGIKSPRDNSIQSTFNIAETLTECESALKRSKMATRKDRIAGK